MINNFEIKKINDEEVLYIYIDDNYEFARINKGTKRKKFLEIISDFIKNNNIKFAGSTIAIVAGGLIIGNLFLNKSNDISLKNCIVSLHLNPQVVDTEVISDEFFEKTSLNSEIESNEEVVVIEQENNLNQVGETSKKENVTNNTNAEINSTEKVTNNKNTNQQEFDESVTVFRTKGEVLTLEMEEYLINVVAAEMPASFNIEALKAQSVLARTYARKAINSGKVLTDSVSTQVYKDNNELKILWGNDYNKYYEKVKSAVMSTRGEVLKYNGDYIEAVYHSTSNGFTEDASNVWGNSFPYLKVVESNLDKLTKNYEVTSFFSYNKLSSLLGFIVNNNTEFNIIERNDSLRVSTISVGENIYTGINFRTLLGLRSADFDIEKLIDGVNITTRGYGHGVGMSQYGANEMAKTGISYTDILNHYYSGTSLVNE